MEPPGLLFDLGLAIGSNLLKPPLAQDRLLEPEKTGPAFVNYHKGFSSRSCICCGLPDLPAECACHQVCCTNSRPEETVTTSLGRLSVGTFFCWQYPMTLDLRDLGDLVSFCKDSETYSRACF